MMTSGTNQSSEAHKNVQSPAEWPQEVLEKYDAVGKLGQGRFGSVWLAKAKNNDKAYVALKVVSHKSKSEMGYANREIVVLKEISHPNIVRLMDYYEAGAFYIIALSYAKGPTLEKIVLRRGAPCSPFCRVVAAQLISAVAYLHSRAVLHRDIKPNNIVIKGINLDKDDVWEDQSENNLNKLMERWTVILLDFGLARALSPAAIDVDIGLYRTLHGVTQDEIRVYENLIDEPMVDGKVADGKNTPLDVSLSRKPVRNLSAVGQRNYAAPEIRLKAHDFEREMTSSGHNVTKPEDEPLIDVVADYGMVADAFSLGATLRHMFTGVPPLESVDDFLAMQNNPFTLLAKCICGNSKKPKRIYRKNSELPREAVKLILGLTHYNPKKRTTARGARSDPWVSELLSESHHSIAWERGIVFLDYVLQKNEPPEEAQVVVIDEDEQGGLTF